MLASLNAQTFQAVSSKTTLAKKTQMGVMAKEDPISRSKATFYTNDFSVAGDWTIANNAAGAGANDNWVLGTAGPAGAFAIDPIASTSAANGFALFDSDLYCTGDQSAWIGNSAAIDCSAHPSVVIDFESFYRKFNDEVYVQVSTDNVNFTNYRVYETYTNNDASTNPELTSVNISATAGSQASVYIRFLFLSDASNGGDGCGYAWMIDDVSLRDADAMDLVLNETYWGSTGFWEVRLPYSMVPMAQIAPIQFSGIAANVGATDQNDVVFNVTGSTGYAGSSAVTVAPSGFIDTLIVTPDFTPAATLGVTNLTFNLSSSATDATPTDNLGSSSVEITSSTYARDMNVADGNTYNQGLAYESGNIYDIYANATVTSASVGIDALANAGASIYARLYTIDAATGDFVFAEESAPYILTAADLGNFVTLNLNNPVDLLADNSYLMVVGTLGDGGATNDLVVMTSGKSGGSGFTSTYFLDEAGTWFYSTNTPMVRMGFGAVMPTPVVTSTDTDNILCANATLTLTSDIVGGNVWSNGETTDAITVSAAGTYTVTNAGMTSAPTVVTVQAINTTITVAGELVSVPAQTGAAYQWGTCTPVAPIAGATSNTYTATANGDYSVSVTINGCSAISIPCATVSAVGLNENEAFSSFSVYPNPATENIAIDFSLRAESAVNVSITDLSGKVVYTSNLGNKTAGASSLNVNTAAFANGIYVVNVLTSNGIATEKLVIRK